MLNIFSIQNNNYAPPLEKMYTAVKVVDGDTLVIADYVGKIFSVRLYGIDCPEGKQDFGADARQATYTLVYSQTLKLDMLYNDRYGRSVAIVWLQDNTTLQEKLLAIGAGWVSPRYCARQECVTWKEFERVARESKIGLWKTPHPIPPWEWRKKPQVMTYQCYGAVIKFGFL